MAPETGHPARPGYSRVTPREIRALCRSGVFDRPTAGAALGYAQVNLMILREALAQDFQAFCLRNPRPCPVLEVTPPGVWEPVCLAPGADLRTDLPRYRVLRNGVCVDRPTDILKYWPDGPAGREPDPGAAGVRASRPGYSDLVAFLIGCSFTIESALLDAGLPVRHIEAGVNVPMYRTNIETTPAGPFRGPLVVSMRPMTPQQAETAAKITAALPQVHGAPLHTGNPAVIGIRDLSRPDYGDPVAIRPGEVPVFWACGVTPLEAMLRARPDFAITHEPGHMLVTDLPDRLLVGSG